MKVTQLEIQIVNQVNETFNLDSDSIDVNIDADQPANGSSTRPK